MTDLARRHALKLAAALPLLAAAPSFATSAPPPPRPLKLLVLGGTRFVGPAVVRAALARGHEVTMFNRGVTRPWLFPAVEKRRGNRYPEQGDGLAALKTGEWDAVIDVPAYFPRIVEAAADLLRGRVGQYILVSSISVYSSFAQPGLDESAPTRKLTRDYQERPELSEDWEFGTYGARKVLCEEAAAKRFPDAWTSVRACGIMGGGMSDPSKWYWPAKLHKGGAAVAPGDGLDPVQVIDRRDLADFLIATAERKLTGVYNATGARMTLREMLETTRSVVGGNTEIVWGGDAARERLPGLPGTAPRARAPGFAAVSSAKAHAAGLRDRPLADSIAADWLYFRENHPMNFDFHAVKQGPDPAEEAKLLAELRAKG